MYIAGRVVVATLAIASFSYMTLYNLDLRTYIIEPYFETLPQTIKDIDMKQMSALYATQPVDVDTLKVGWYRFVYKDKLR